MSLIQKLSDKRELLVDNLEKDHLAKLEFAIADLERRIIAEVGSSKLTTNIAIQLRPRLIQLVKENYSTWVYESVKDYDQIAKQILDNFKELPIDPKFATLTAGNAQTIAELKLLSYNQINTIGLEASAMVADEVYASALTGKPFEDVVKSIQEKISGSEGIGRSLRTRARQIAQDAIMGFDSQITALKAEEAGLTHFQYTGNTITDTRQFCRNNINRVFTKAQIEQTWSSRVWQGKSTTNGLVSRGGYNCRHHWSPTDPDWDI